MVKNGLATVHLVHGWGSEVNVKEEAVMQGNGIELG